eukprot:TRINITY_DN2343_c0_g1_i1.p1 TRINITY_DN2343_c0_g1~~TRINITY_DN2343_c0_g1_i1.p1  ORF type:complete len:310 (+),score=93.28 TRINITY_DN2343_c0_g1_i1:34-930(+)
MFDAVDDPKTSIISIDGVNFRRSKKFINDNVGSNFVQNTPSSTEKKEMIEPENMQNSKDVKESEKIKQSKEARTNFTHFFCIMIDNLDMWQDALDLLSKELEQHDGFDIQAQMDKESSHITISMASIPFEEICIVKDIFEGLEPIIKQIFENCVEDPIKLKGFKTFQENHKKTRVLWLKPVKNSVTTFIYEVLDILYEYLAPYLPPHPKEDPTLHATIFNSKYIRNKKKRRNTATIDAKDVLEKYCEYDFGESIPLRCCLARMKRVKPHGYVIDAQINLDQNAPSPFLPDELKPPCHK